MPRTVFVIGAGAAAPYGLPTAQELKDRIVKGHSPVLHDDELQEMLEARHKKLRRAFAGAPQYSIDAFLESRPDEFLEDGKFLIAAELLPLEAAAITHSAIAGNWMQWLFNRLFKRRSIDCDGITFIIFNYDRLLEISFATMLVNGTGMSPAEAMDIVRRIPIYHVYGQLISDVRFDDDDQLFRSECNTHAIRQSAKNIKLMRNEREEAEDQVLRMARAAVWEAERVVCLGFGYDHTNLQRIGMWGDYGQWSTRNRIVVGTAVGKCSREINDIKRVIGRIELESGWECERFLKEQVPM